MCIPTCWCYGESRRRRRLVFLAIDFGASPAGESNKARTQPNTPMPSPNASLWGRHGMEKQGLGHLSISPSNHRVAEFHRLIKNGHFWGRATPFFSRSPSPSWAVLGAPDLPTYYPTSSGIYFPIYPSPSYSITYRPLRDCVALLALLLPRILFAALSDWGHPISCRQP